MKTSPTTNFTAFAGGSQIATGSQLDVALAVKEAHEAGISRLLVFDDQDGRPVEFDLRGSAEDVRARLDAPVMPTSVPGRGRPKLGVTAREVTLLPSEIMPKTRRAVKNKMGTNRLLSRRRVNPLAC